MSEYSHYADLLPVYISGKLPDAERRAIQAHLEVCPQCQADLALWTAVAAEVVAVDRTLAAPPDLANRALVAIHDTERQTSTFRRAVQLLRSQVPLVRREIWPASAAIMAMGSVAAIQTRDAAVLQILAPLAATASIAVIYGPENDPAVEMAMATPTSPWQILLSRVALVFGYNLALAMVASLALLPVMPSGLLAGLVLGWLGPMAFLSAAALVLSLWIGTGNAIAVAYVAWLARLLTVELRETYSPLAVAPIRLVLSGYEQFWNHPLALLALSAPLFAAALWFAGRQERNLPHCA